MEIKFYNIDELLELLLQMNIDKRAFLDRISTYTFEPKIIIIWDGIDKEINQWYIDNKEYMIGQSIESYISQIEFECEEDALAFILRWS